MDNSKALFWVQDIDMFLAGKTVSGILIQMSTWANAFKQNGWKVYGLSQKKDYVDGGFNYVRLPFFKFINLLVLPFVIAYILLKVRPHVIVCNGASRDLCFVALFAHLLRAKVIQILASDTDAEPGKELIEAYHDKVLYRMGVRLTNMFVVQNIRQQKLMDENYHKSSIVIPSVWNVNKQQQNNAGNSRELILWVANFRSLKRPEWFMDIAELMPGNKFMMIGGPNDHTLFDACNKRAATISNLIFTGTLGLEQVNDYFAQARLLICTSEIEGFPNTFLQAWANAVPIISTFDPSGLIQSRNLGRSIVTKEEIIMAINELECPEIYQKIQGDIATYFHDNHNAQQQYEYMTQAFKLN